DAVLLWVMISKTDYSFTEGQWTLSNAKMMDVGSREFGSYPERVVKCCVRGGYLYVPAYDKKGIYKINLGNSTDVTLIEFGFTSKWKPLCETGNCELYMTLIGDLIIGRSEEHTSELQSRFDLVCRLLLEKKKRNKRKRQKEKKQKTSQRKKMMHIRLGR